MASSVNLVIKRCISGSRILGAASTPTGRTPIKIFGKQGVYANALYSASSKANNSDIVEKDLLKFNDAWLGDAAFREYIQNPITLKREKLARLKEMAKKLSFQPITINFLETVVDNSRIKLITQYITSFRKIMDSVRGELVCTVTTAKPLDKSMNAELMTTLNGFLKKGETIKVESKVDPSIIGGMIVEIGDSYIDMSTSTKIKKMTDAIQAPIEN